MCPTPNVNLLMANTSIKFSLTSASSTKRKRPPTPNLELRSCFDVSAQCTDDVQMRAKKMMLCLEDQTAKLNRLQNEGNILADDGRFRAAMARWQEALSIDPLNAVLLELMAQASMAVNDDFQAVQWAMKAVDSAPEWGEAYHTLARCHRNFGELLLAQKNITKAIELLGPSEELICDRDEINVLVEKQTAVLKARQKEEQQTHDEMELQAISCLKHLALRGRTAPF